MPQKSDFCSSLMKIWFILILSNIIKICWQVKLTTKSPCQGDTATFADNKREHWGSA